MGREDICSRHTDRCFGFRRHGALGVGSMTLENGTELGRRMKRVQGWKDAGSGYQTQAKKGLVLSVAACSGTVAVAWGMNDEREAKAGSGRRRTKWQRN